MMLSEFGYDLPKELIAQYPSKGREKCRLMVLDRKSRSIEEGSFEDIAGYFNAGDLVVLNDTKVIPARLFGKRKSGGKVEIFVLEKKNPVCEALIKPSGRLKEGEKVMLETGDEVEVLERGDVGRFVRFDRPLDDILNQAGHTPLPPYIDRGDEPSDRIDYQTVYAAKDGATASPTAGLHFTKELLKKIEDRGVKIEYLTLHTSYGTFAPVKSEDVESHRMHKEYFELPANTAKAIVETKKNGGGVFAVGTTTTRVLEHCASQTMDHRPKTADHRPQTKDLHGYTDLFIFPGFKFKVVDHLITNFHLPRSTLLLLVSAFAGKEFIFEAYQRAIEARYRFFSYGDAMLII